MSDTDEKKKLGIDGPDDEKIPGGISPAEQAQLDQIEAGLRDDEEDDEGGLYSGGDRNKPRGWLSRRKALIGGGLLGLSGLTIGGFIFVLPLFRIPAMIANAEQKAMFFVVDAIGNRAEHLFDAYMIKNILSLQTCRATTSTVSTSCRPDYGGSGIISTVYRTWRGVGIEEKIFDDLGFRLDTVRNPDASSGGYRYTLFNRRGEKIKDLTNEFDYRDFKNGQFTGGSRALGKDIQFSLKKETHWYQVLYRRKVRKYFSDVHDVRFWCFLACNTKDNVELKTLTAKTKVKAFLIDRLVYPFSAKYGFALECLMKSNCDPEGIKDVHPSRNPAEIGELKEIAEQVKRNQNFSSFIIERILIKVGLKEGIAKTITSSIPVAGWVYAGIWAFDLLSQADEAIDNNKLSQLAADINSSQYREVYQVIKASSDEIKSGALTVAEIGALNAEFAGAEQSLLYQADVPGSTTASIFGGSVYAESVDDYRCADGKPVPAGELVCSEKKVARTYAIEDLRDNAIIGTALDAYFVWYRADFCFGAVTSIDLGLFKIGPDDCSIRGIVRPTLSGIDKVSTAVLGPVADAISGVAKAVPFVGDMYEFLSTQAGNLIRAIFEYIFPLPWNANSPGREKYDAFRAGSEVVAQDLGRGGYDGNEPYGLGAPTLTEAEAEQIYFDYQKQLEYEYAHSSLYAKITDYSNERSLAFRMIQSSPSSPQEAISNFASSLFNLFGAFSNLAAPANASTNTTLYNSAFGIKRYGYPVNNSYLTIDPGELNDETCSKDGKFFSDWEASKTTDSQTGFDEYGTPNPCLLEEVVADSLGAYFTNE